MHNNNKVSGGLPHSEIHGSKLILSSPWLIAEYHVFHRLLLPRHPPNALFALDLIQKKRGFSCGPTLLYLKWALNQNAYIVVTCRWFATSNVRMRLLSFRLVYLTWNKIDFQGLIRIHAEPSSYPANFFTRSASILMLYLSKRCHLDRSPKRPIGRLNSQNCLAI